MIDPLSPHAQVPAPGRTRPLLLRPLALAAALVLAACSSEGGARNTAEESSSAPPPSVTDETDTEPILTPPTMDDAYRCMEDPTYSQFTRECDLLGVTPTESMMPVDTESQAKDGLSYLWPSGIRTTVEVVDYSAGAPSSTYPDEDRQLTVRLVVTNESDVALPFGLGFGSDDPTALVPDLAVYQGVNGELATSYAHGEGYPERLSPGTSESNEFLFGMESGNNPVEMRVSLTTQDILAEQPQVHVFKNFEEVLP